MELTKILIITLFITMVLPINVFATGDILDTGESWLNTGQAHAHITLSSEKLREGSGELYNILLAVGTAVAVIVGGILGVRYMTAGIDKKVEVKESLFPYIISCIVLFGSLGIWKLVVTVMGQV